MKKHYESAKRFGKEENGEAARRDLLEGFIQEYGERAYGFARMLAGNGDEAHELVQETLYRVILTWDQYEASKPLGAWFMTILRNAFLDGRRRSDRRRMISLDCPIKADGEICYADVIPEPQEGIQTALERKETVALARRALGRMSRQQREVLTLSDMDGLKYEEIAAILRISTGTVRSRIHRARQAFRRMWPKSEIVA